MGSDAHDDSNVPDFSVHRFSFLERSDVEARVLKALKNLDHRVDPAKVTPTAHFRTDLGLDSLVSSFTCGRCF